MGLLYLEDKDRYCVYNFKTKQIIQELYGGETVRVLIDNKPVLDTIGYKNRQWCLTGCGYIGEDLNGLDIVQEQKTFVGALKSIIKKIF